MAIVAGRLPYMTGMPTLSLTLPLRIRILEDAACVEDAAGRRTGYVYWSADARRDDGAGVFTRPEAIEQVRLIARAWADALAHSGTPDTGPAPEPGAAAAEPSPQE